MKARVIQEFTRRGELQPIGTLLDLPEDKMSLLAGFIEIVKTGGKSKSPSLSPAKVQQSAEQVEPAQGKPGDRLKDIFDKMDKEESDRGKIRELLFTEYGLEPFPVELNLCRYDLLHKTSIGNCHPETCNHDAVGGICQYDDPDDEERAKHPGIFADKHLSSLFKVR